ncbi:MAG: cupin domain-containing protein [Candidatus Riflemargulisbacteria bacterium]
MLTAKQIITKLKLIPHPEEGGFYRETYRSTETIEKDALPLRYMGGREYCTCIYYLLTPTTFSHIHRLQSDEIFHFYLGDPCEMIQLSPDGTGEIITLGQDIESEQQMQIVVNKHTWQGMKLKEGGKFALLGTTVAPSFEFQDYEHGKRESLLIKYPEFQEQIINLTKD